RFRRNSRLQQQERWHHERQRGHHRRCKRQRPQHEQAIHNGSRGKVTETSQCEPPPTQDSQRQQTIKNQKKRKRHTQAAQGEHYGVSCLFSSRRFCSTRSCSSSSNWTSCSETASTRYDSGSEEAAPDCSSCRIACPAAARCISSWVTHGA